MIGNGLCIIESFRRNYFITFNKTFLKSDVNLQLELDNCIKDPLKYSGTDSRDIYLIALVKSYTVNIIILRCDVEKCWENKFLDINLSDKNILYFVRSLSNHVDPVLPILKDTVIKVKIDHETNIICPYVP